VAEPELIIDEELGKGKTRAFSLGNPGSAFEFPYIFCLTGEKRHVTIPPSYWMIHGHYAF
jgi:hypothetical protein